MIINLDSLADDPSGGLYTVEDLRKMYEYGGIRLTTNGVTSLRKICMTPRSGRLRTCSSLIEMLHTSSIVIDSGIISKTTLVDAIKQLELPLKDWLPLVTIDRFGGSDEEEQSMAASAG